MTPQRADEDASSGRGDQIFAQLSQLNEQLRSLQQALADRDAELGSAKAELAQARDVVDKQNAALVAANVQLAALATLDGLTGVKNRRALDARLDEELRRAERHPEQPLSLVMLDVDHFKLYNDTFGHLAGDDVLRLLGAVLLAQARSTDFAARYGGEEFVVLLPSTAADEARRATERLQLALATARWPVQPVTVSFGVTTTCGQPTTADALVGQADKALYHSKQAGRNCVTHWVDLAARDG